MPAESLKHQSPVCTYRSGNLLCKRTVSPVVLTGTVDVPEPPARLVADWQRDTLINLALEHGDVDVLPLVRTRARWAGLQSCIAAATQWTAAYGLHTALATSDMALMTCRGARYHHDGLQYGAFAFCNLFLSEDKGLDLHFPALGIRIPLRRGTAVVFDTCQPHAVIPRNASDFQATDFAPDSDYTQVFLTWELPLANQAVASRLGVSVLSETEAEAHADEAQVCMDGASVHVCAQSGQWQAAGN